MNRFRRSGLTAGVITSYSIHYTKLYDSNGIDAQDKEEIAAFMEIAKPYIDRFMEEVSGDQQSTPLNKFADSITSAMA